MFQLTDWWMVVDVVVWVEYWTGHGTDAQPVIALCTSRAAGLPESSSNSRLQVCRCRWLPLKGLELICTIKCLFWHQTNGVIGVKAITCSLCCRVVIKTVHCDAYVDLLNQKTEEIERLINEKKALVADILQIPLHDYDTVAEVCMWMLHFLAHVIELVKWFQFAKLILHDMIRCNWAR